MLRLSRRFLEAELLSGLALSKEIRRRVRVEAQLLSRPPCLAVVLVGERHDSERYVRNKKRAAAECGIGFRLIWLPATASQMDLHRELVAVNTDPDVDGVLLQLPLPPHLRARPALFHIHPAKDVDGLHPLNAGNLFIRDVSPLANAVLHSNDAPSDTDALGAAVDESIIVANQAGSFSSIARRSHERNYFIPCTALAVRSLLFSYLSSKALYFQRDSCPSTALGLHVVIVNTSMVVGVPVAALLQKEHGFTVTMCSRGTPLEAIQRLTREADVLVAAYGQANVFNADFVKKDAIVIDVAINERPDDFMAAARAAQEGRSRTLCGDVDYDSVRGVVRAITPVPGGVGPLTVAHLMQNVMKAARLRHDTRFFYTNIYTTFLSMYGAALPVSDDTTATVVDGSTASASDTPATAAPPASGLTLPEEFADDNSFDC